MLGNIELNGGAATLNSGVERERSGLETILRWLEEQPDKVDADDDESLADQVEHGQSVELHAHSGLPADLPGALVPGLHEVRVVAGHEGLVGGGGLLVIPTTVGLYGGHHDHDQAGQSDGDAATEVHHQLGLRGIFLPHHDQREEEGKDQVGGGDGEGGGEHLDVAGGSSGDALYVHSDGVEAGAGLRLFCPLRNLKKFDDGENVSSDAAQDNQPSQSSLAVERQSRHQFHLKKSVLYGICWKSSPDVVDEPRLLRSYIMNWKIFSLFTDFILAEVSEFTLKSQ